MVTSPLDTKIQGFLSQSGIPHEAAGSAEFAALQESFTGRHDAKKPSFIVRPQKAEDVAAVVKFCVETKTPIVVRGRGHDMFGRFHAAGAVNIDLRDLNTVTVDADKKTAWVQGGTESIAVLKALQPHGLQVPVGSCGWVGFVGWCLIAGFGPYSHSYGLGADQIVGARVVNAKGELVDADDRMLEGLRGGGGSLGIVVELRVKVYPVEEINAGTVLFESSDIAKTVSTFFTNYNKLYADHGKLPSQLAIMPTIWMIPGLGLTLAAGFVWNGFASDESRAWFDRVAGLATLMPNSPAPKTAMKMTAAEHATLSAGMLPKQVVGGTGTQTISVSKLSEETINAIAAASAKIPSDSAGGISFHILHADSPSVSSEVPPSVLPFREPIIALELLGLGADDASAEKAAAWSLEARNELSRVSDVSEKTYLALTSAKFVDLEKIYGEKLKKLKELKDEYDPDRVFRHTIPQLD